MSGKYDEGIPQEITAVSLSVLLAKYNAGYNEQISTLHRRIKELESIREKSSVEEKAVRNKIRVVVLVHGIRDQALWQSEVRASLRAANFQVVLTNYGRFDLIRFLLPIPTFRNAVVKSVRDQIRSIRLREPNSDISVIAHSFGTYIMSRVMSDEFDIMFDRIIFCGGVYSNKIKFEQFSNRFSPPIINEVGAKDFWPALASSVTWGYGSPGTFGFRRPLFEDRWHRDADHSYFLSKCFCSKYWVPFLLDGRVESGEESPDQPHVSVRIAHVIQIKYIVLFALIYLVYKLFI